MTLKILQPNVDSKDFLRTHQKSLVGTGVVTTAYELSGHITEPPCSSAATFLS